MSDKPGCFYEDFASPIRFRKESLTNMQHMKNKSQVYAVGFRKEKLANIRCMKNTCCTSVVARSQHEHVTPEWCGIDLCASSGSSGSH